MSDNPQDNDELTVLTEEQFEDTEFWSEMLDEPDAPSFVERPDRTEGFLDDEELPVHTEDVKNDTNDTNDEEQVKEVSRPIYFFIIIGIIGFLILAGATFSIYRIFFYGNTDTSSEKNEGVVATQTESPQEKETIAIENVEYTNTVWEPFWIRIQKNGKEVFVTLSFSTTTSSPKTVQELEHKELVIRDAIYYYLQHITLSSNTETIEKIKKDITEIINSYISSGSIESLGIETFFVQ